MAAQDQTSPKTRLQTRLRGFLNSLARPRRELLRIALQTGAATLATYLLVAGLGGLDLSWAIISALLTIGMSADLSYTYAVNRTAGACLGALIGLALAVLIGGPAIYALLVAVILANMVATIWPSLQYGAVTAAIVALEPDPELAAALSRTGAIVAGSCIGAVASFLIWPMRGRDRAEIGILDTLHDCQDMLTLINRGVSTDEHDRRDALHRRFLQHLDIARSRVAESRFSPALKTGADLRSAVRGVETLWHALVILDRAVTTERGDISAAALDRLAPAVDAVQDSAKRQIDRIIAMVKGTRDTAPPHDDLHSVVARARDQATDLAQEAATDWPGQARALHSVIFGLNETERQLDQISKILAVPDDRPDDARGVT
ncbi:fusaric acid resistance protein-like protein [Yoonia vestfoldensis]|uniref:Fusaric acid resistance protein-like protein n=2 Tax=Yoonia vestfoldensis TaxID=245188 RepID=A0A1Y0ECA1_9RHOB|nr:fusaric acid resistance protein-like protein [Yoonia vestfoldensis]